RSCPRWEWCRGTVASIPPRPDRRCWHRPFPWCAPKRWQRPPRHAEPQVINRTYNYVLPLMENNTVLVLTDPTEPILAMLDDLPDETTIAAGNSVEAFERTAADANVIFSWSISGSLLEKVFQMAPRVRWIHSRSAGLDGVLFPALIESPVPLTNGRGVFSE